MFGCYGLYLAPSPLFRAGALFKDVHQIFVMLFAAHCRLINGQSALGVSYSCAYPDPITHLCEESAAPAVEEEEEEGGGRCSRICCVLVEGVKCGHISQAATLMLAFILALQSVAVDSDCTSMAAHLRGSKSIWV